MANPGDPYKILGVAKDADQDEIKKSYRKLAMKYHPDRNPGDKEAEDKFKEAAHAYEILGDPEKRARFDRFGHAGLGGPGGGGQGFQNMEDIFSSFSDIFGDFFGGGARQRENRNGPRKGADLRYISDVSFLEVLEGAEKDITFETEENCKTCNGSGAAKGSSPETCPTCGGSGQVVRSQGFFSMATTCPGCGGAGQIIRNPCKTCHGQGRTSVRRNIRVTIPPGVDSGTRLRVSGEGEGGHKGGPAGDLYVEIRVRESKNFVRRGPDLFSIVKISYLQAILGGEVDVPTVKGTATLTIPRGTQVGDSLRIQGAGFPALKTDRKGDLYCQIEVEFPKKISKEEENHLREVAKIRGDKVASGRGIFG